MNVPTPMGDSDGVKFLKIAGLVLLGLVALCGIAGTCLFAALLMFGGFSQ